LTGRPLLGHIQIEIVRKCFVYKTGEVIRMNRWIWTCGTVFLCCVLVIGCHKQANDQDAIRASIDKHLNETVGLNLSAMDREVKQISVNGDHASAQVEFRLKQGGDARMEIEYTLERQGKMWAVLKSAPIGGGSSQPGAQGPPNAPDTGGGSLLSGHPPSN
jgi:hypothetical protein